MRGLLTILTPATARALTTREAVCAELGADAPGPDALPGLIAAASAAAERWCGRTFARETVREVFRDPLPRAPAVALVLARAPLFGAPAVTLDGTPLVADTDFEADGLAGLLWRLSGDRRCAWRAAKVVVTYTAGFALPGQAGADLPADVQRAVTLIAAAAVHAAGRDPALRSSSTEGVGSESYLDPRAGMEAMPPQAAALLGPWRMPAL